MHKADLNGVTLELWDKGSGEPVVFVHSVMGDECAAVIVEPVKGAAERLVSFFSRHPMTRP
jgi:hypothetical protein